MEELAMKEKQEMKSNENMIKWNELDSLIGKPVFDVVDKKWRVLRGYRRIMDRYYIIFTDGTKVESNKDCTDLFRSETE